MALTQRFVASKNIVEKSRKLSGIIAAYEEAGASLLFYDIGTALPGNDCLIVLRYDRADQATCGRRSIGSLHQYFYTIKGITDRMIRFLSAREVTDADVRALALTYTDDQLTAMFCMHSSHFQHRYGPVINRANLIGVVGAVTI